MSAFNRTSWQRFALAIISKLPFFGEAALLVVMRRAINPKALTLNKVRNFILANRESDLKRIQVKSLPCIINMDTINACNLACPFCVTGTKQLDRKQTRFPLDQAKAVIDQVKSHILIARFHNWGEPFLNKELFKLVRYAHDAGIHTTLSSNLSISVDNLAEKVVASGLDQIHVSIDGLKQETLERYRRKADFNLVMKNIRAIVAEKRRTGSRTPRLELAFLVFRHNEHEVPQLKAMQEELGVESFTAQSAFIFHESFVPKESAFQPGQSIWQDNCHYLYSELMVEADGHISPCCTNTSERFDVGTVAEIGDLHAFWNKPIFSAMRAKSSGQPWKGESGKQLETLCDYCRYIGSGKENPTGTLSPLPPALAAAGNQFDHELDDSGQHVPKKADKKNSRSQSALLSKKVHSVRIDEISIN